MQATMTTTNCAALPFCVALWVLHAPGGYALYMDWSNGERDEWTRFETWDAALAAADEMAGNHWGAKYDMDVTGKARAHFLSWPSARRAA